ncbi:MAG: aminotransferase class I/II-fold pyridoxal phosphate-dependent enzyme [Proteobacteria bacterium]|nr:aminotransferase class I/II-fold pyridoxal phosphate-dependent enzyme [Pseudomonadota bacterium]
MKTALLAPSRVRTLSSPDRNRIQLAPATERDRETIYRIRHEVFAHELGQHSPNSAALLRDALDDFNLYLVAKVAGEVAAFVSLTPPSAPSYSMDKYLAREQLPFAFDSQLYEVRLLTVVPTFRGSELAALLMYAAFRWVEAHGGTRLMAIGRREVLELYLRGGLEPVGMAVQSGAVTYDVLQAPISAIRERIQSFGGLLDRLESRVDWQLNFPFRRPAACFHGGAFFDAIGPRFDHLERHRNIINADVLDAWFPPSPQVLAALSEHPSWLLRTSPPTACEGLVETIAEARGVAPANILPGAGSSDLIFRALRHWLTPASHALILDPTYGEYAHVLEKVIGCTVDRLTLAARDGFAVDLTRLESALADDYNLVVLVNPNSPTGRHIPREQLEAVLRRAPQRTRIWVDETYVEYAGPNQSLEHFAATSENALVCKSMSKVYALSGARVAYLCAGPHQLEALRAITPPWVVSLPAQVAAVRALQDPAYYAARYAETAALREQFAVQLRKLGLKTVPGIANFILCQLPSHGPDAATVVKQCRKHGVFLRDASVMGSQLGTHALRIAVKDAETNGRIVDCLSAC